MCSCIGRSRSWLSDGPSYWLSCHQHHLLYQWGITSFSFTSTSIRKNDSIVYIKQYLLQGALVTACSNDMVHLWNFRQKHPEILHSLQMSKVREYWSYYDKISNWNVQFEGDSNGLLIAGRNYLNASPIRRTMVDVGHGKGENAFDLIHTMVGPTKRQSLIAGKRVFCMCLNVPIINVRHQLE